MFTGIITDVGSVRSVDRGGVTRLGIATRFNTAEIDLGASIACNGCCLTVVAREPGAFFVEASGETLARTTLGTWQAGTPVNLERSLRLGDELGGHLVFGHVDGTAEILDISPEGDTHRWRFRAPAGLARYLARKGSVALDGVSLTVNEVEGADFTVVIIPHTRDHTSFRGLSIGQRVNIEIDMLARYVDRMLAMQEG